MSAERPHTRCHHASMLYSSLVCEGMVLSTAHKHSARRYDVTETDSVHSCDGWARRPQQPYSTSSCVEAERVAWMLRRPNLALSPRMLYSLHSCPIVFGS